MIIIPAIDLKDGKCVRLKQGRMDMSTVFNDNPVEQAIIWESMGAKMIHIVDLNGSVDGKPVNLPVIKEIAKRVKAPLELGGGVRDKTTAKMYLDIGVDVIILGTIAAKNPTSTISMLEELTGKISIGIDARSGKVAVQGWTESTELDAGELASKYDLYGPRSFIYTDIERDGMMVGPNFSATQTFARAVKTEVILSGGVSTIDDVKRASALENDGVKGIIIGRALYEGAINLRDAITVT
ncbi:MAG: 1-(5-phosphoribosyl)-5-[(5-phosphoribosylamino)methylideneamino]imidazole-4-carboxamide isomerase, partial [Desulfomonilaceae bacterium]